VEIAIATPIYSRERFWAVRRAASDMDEPILFRVSDPSADHNDLLLQQMVGGDDEAFTTLFSWFNPKLERYFARQLGTGTHVQDLAQEVWVRMINLRKTPTKAAPPFRVQAFLFRVARNLAIDFVRTRKVHVTMDDMEEIHHPIAKQAEISDAEELVGRAFEMLSDDFREVLTLNLDLGYRFDEIAEMLGKTPEAIWARASRARMKLRRLLVEIAEREGISLRDYLTNTEQ
jgi:RNA polymerase sigma-70 factor (ECF subfamily)